LARPVDVNVIIKNTTNDWKTDHGIKQGYKPHLGLYNTAVNEVAAVM